MNFIVYQLKLVEDKHYFGHTPTWRKQIRLNEHIRGTGSKWTRRFPPIGENPVVNTWGFDTRKEADFFENQKCEDFLNMYGIDSTRGGKQNYGDVGNYDWWVRSHLRHLIPSTYK